MFFSGSQPDSLASCQVLGRSNFLALTQPAKEVKGQKLSFRPRGHPVVWAQLHSCQTIPQGPGTVCLTWHSVVTRARCLKCIKWALET